MWDITGKFIIGGARVVTGLLVRLCRICGVRDIQEPSQGEGDLGEVEGGLGEVGDGYELQDQAQASSPPPYSVSHYIFLSVL